MIYGNRDARTTKIQYVPYVLEKYLFGPIIYLEIVYLLMEYALTYINPA